LLPRWHAELASLGLSPRLVVAGLDGVRYLRLSARASIGAKRNRAVLRAAAAAADAVSPARSAVAGYGRTPQRASTAVTGAPFGRCARITVTVAYAVPLVALPGIAAGRAEVGALGDQPAGDARGAGMLVVLGPANQSVVGRDLEEAGRAKAGIGTHLLTLWFGTHMLAIAFPVAQAIATGRLPGVVLSPVVVREYPSATLAAQGQPFVPRLAHRGCRVPGPKWTPSRLYCIRLPLLPATMQSKQRACRFKKKLNPQGV